MYSEPEVAAAFERAQVLCDLLPESPARARARRDRGAEFCVARGMRLGMIGYY